MQYHTFGQVINFPQKACTERLLDLPEIRGEIWIENSAAGWLVHHQDDDADHGSIVASKLPDRGSAISAALAFALGLVARPTR